MFDSVKACYKGNVEGFSVSKGGQRMSLKLMMCFRTGDYVYCASRTSEIDFGVNR